MALTLKLACTFCTLSEFLKKCVITYEAAQLAQYKNSTPINILTKLVGCPKGPFNNYVDKMRGEGVKNACFCPRLGYKNCIRRGGGGSNNGKILST